MIDITRSTAALQGLVGWLNTPADPDVPELEDSNADSASGLYFEHASGCLTLKNVLETIPTYVNTGEDATEQFNAFLLSMTTSGIKKLLHSFTARVRKDDGSDVVESFKLFPYETSYSTESALPTAGFVGYRIDVARGFRCTIQTILTEFNVTGTTDVYLVNAQTRAISKVKTTALSTEAGKQKLNDVSLSLESGTHYIGYFTAGMVMKPINRADNGTEQAKTFAVQIRRIRVADHATVTAFNPNDVDYVGETWGLNFDAVTYCDYTEQVIQSREMFARAVQLQVATEWLSIFLNTNRTNREERLLKQAKIELDGIMPFEMVPGKDGILKQLQAEIESLYNRLIAQPKIRTI